MHLPGFSAEPTATPLRQIPSFRILLTRILFPSADPNHIRRSIDR
jgi:hypothetical protein